MENNQNSKTAQANTNQQNSTQNTAGSNQPQSKSTTSSTNSSTSQVSQSSNSGAANTMQGRSNQQATSGKGGLKDIQGKLQQFGSTAATKVNGLSTTQKVIGGSLLALGAGWLALSSKNKNGIKNKVSSIASKAKSKSGEGSTGSPNISAR